MIIDEPEGIGAWAKIGIAFGALVFVMIVAWLILRCKNERVKKELEY